MKRRAVVLLLLCTSGLLIANSPGKFTPTHQDSTTNGGVNCKRCGHSKKEHYQNKYMCMLYDGCPSFI